MPHFLDLVNKEKAIREQEHQDFLARQQSLEMEFQAFCKEKVQEVIAHLEGTGITVEWKVEGENIGRELVDKQINKAQICYTFSFPLNPEMEGIDNKVTMFSEKIYASSPSEKDKRFFFEDDYRPSYATYFFYVLNNSTQKVFLSEVPILLVDIALDRLSKLQHGVS